MVAAATNIPGAYLWLVGDGKEKPISNPKLQLGMADRVRFIGWVAEPAPYIAASDVFCMPSRHEPLGNVVLEAWQLQIPTIASSSEGPTWFMRDGQNGLLFPIGDVQALTQALQRLKADSELGAVTGRRGHPNSPANVYQGCDS